MRFGEISQKRLAAYFGGKIDLGSDFARFGEIDGTSSATLAAIEFDAKMLTFELTTGGGRGCTSDKCNTITRVRRRLDCMLINSIRVFIISYIFTERV